MSSKMSDRSQTLHTRPCIIGVACLLLSVSPALASDGVLEINQTCAVETGCFPGDSAGWPVTIPEAGSYRLTSNLVVPDENTTAVAAGAGDVTIDLNGFSVSGPTVCSGTPVTSCAPTGRGIGISGGTFDNVTVRNGTVRGFGNRGVNLGGSHAVVERLRVFGNGGTGIASRLGVNMLVTDSIASRNGDDGISVLNNCLVRDNVAHGNRTTGITALNDCLVVNNILKDNGGSFSLSVDDSAYRGNVIDTAPGGVTVSSGTDLGANVCNGQPSCP